MGRNERVHKAFRAATAEAPGAFRRLCGQSIVSGYGQSSCTVEMLPPGYQPDAHLAYFFGERPTALVKALRKLL